MPESVGLSGIWPKVFRRKWWLHQVGQAPSYNKDKMLCPEFPTKDLERNPNFILRLIIPQDTACLLCFAV